MVLAKIHVTDEALEHARTLWLAGAELTDPMPNKAQLVMELINNPYFRPKGQIVTMVEIL